MLWKQESFVVLRPLQIEFFRNLLVSPHVPQRWLNDEVSTGIDDTPATFDLNCGQPLVEARSVVKDGTCLEIPSGRVGLGGERAPGWDHGQVGPNTPYLMLVSSMV